MVVNVAELGSICSLIGTLPFCSGYSNAANNPFLVILYDIVKLPQSCIILHTALVGGTLSITYDMQTFNELKYN